MSAYALPRRLLRLSLVISLPILALALILLPPRIAYAGGEVTDCSDDTDLHAKLAGGGLVTFNCGSAPVTITLTTTDLPGSHISIIQTTTISGGGLITLESDGTARIFNVDGSSLNLQGLGITRGRGLTALDDGGAIYIENGGVVSITDSSLFDNQAQLGGAVYAENGVLTITNTSLHNNQSLFGGALYLYDAAPAISPLAAATIINSAIISNTAMGGDGGAIRVWDGRLTLANSTLSDNRAIETAGGVGGDGGAIGIGGTEARGYSQIFVTNTTIYSNSAAADGGGIHIDSGTGSGRVKNSIIANNAASAGANCSANNLVSDGHNLASDDTCNFNASGDLTNINPLVGPLAHNGGSTLTHAPLPGSPVINAADNNACAAPPVSNVDQRGVSRPQGVTCDIGAVEATTNLSLVKSSTNQGGDPVHPAERITYTIVATNTGSLTATNALISDTLPANTTFVPGSISLTPPDVGTAGVAPPTLASDLTLTHGQSVTVTFAVTVNLPLPNGTVITNTAGLTSAETPSPVSDSVTDTVSSATSLAIRKSSQDANGGALIPSDTVTYTIVVSNSGTASATGAVLSDTLPANTTFITDSIRLTPSSAGTAGTVPPILASDLTVSPLQPVTVAFAATVNLPLPDGTVITNTASFTSTEAPSPISDTVTDTISSATDLAIRKSSQDANGGALIPGDTISYTIVVSNSGTATATGAVLSDTLPANTTFVPGSISLTPPDVGTSGTEPPTLASDLTVTPSQPVTVAFAATVNLPLPNGTVITNTASFTSTESPSPVSDSVTDTVTSAPSLAISKSSQDANGGALIPGDTISYTIVVSNSGTANATGAVIADILSADTTFVPDSISLTPPDVGTAGTEPPTLASDLAINVSEVVTVSFAATVNLPLPDGTVITNTASLTSAETLIPISDSVTDTVTSAPSLAIGKSSQDPNGGALIPGDTISYTIVVDNSGTANATGAVLSDTLPANTTFVPGSISLTPAGAGTPGTEPPNLASDLAINVSEPVTVSFAATVNLPLPNGTVITNTASLTSAETLIPISDSVTDTVTSAPSLAISKSSQDANGGALIPGDTISYTIVVSNSGTANATGAVIADTLSSDTTFVPGSISLTPPGAGTPGTEPPTLASDLAINVSEVVTVAFAATVNLPLPDGTAIVNTASLTSIETPSPVSAMVTDTVSSATSLAIGKSSQDTNGGDLNPGDTIAYTIVVSNSGTASATGAVLSDILPENTTFVPGSINVTPPDAGTPGTAPPVLASDLTVTPGQPVTVDFDATVNLPLPDGTVITNIASFTSTESLSPISDSVTDIVTSAPSLAISKSSQDANGGALSPGDTLTYTIVVDNIGTETAAGAVISDTLPANTTFVPGSISLTPAGAGTPGTVPPTLASNLIISPIQPVIVAFAVTLDKPLDDGTIIANTASVTSTRIPAPETDSIIDTVSTTAAINVVKDGPLMADVDETVVYIFTVTNVGDTLLENVQVVDDYAGPANYVSGDDGDFRLGLTETWVYTGSYTIQPDDPNTVINVVTATAEDALNNETTDTDEHRTRLGPASRLPLILNDFGP